MSREAHFAPGAPRVCWWRTEGGVHTRTLTLHRGAHPDSPSIASIAASSVPERSHALQARAAHDNADHAHLDQNGARPDWNASGSQHGGGPETAPWNTHTIQKHDPAPHDSHERCTGGRGGRSALDSSAPSACLQYKDKRGGGGGQDARSGKDHGTHALHKITHGKL